MNKNYYLMLTLTMALFTSMSYASEGRIITYNEILSAYNTRTLGIFGDKNKAITVVEKHTTELRKQKDQIESSYIPGLLKIIATSLVASSAFLFGRALYGTYGLYSILSQPQETFISKIVYGPALTYFEFMKYLYSFDKDTMSTFNTRGKYTQEFLDKMVPKDLEKVVELGGIAPLLGAGSLLTAAVSGFLFKQVAANRRKILDLQDSIKRDEEIIKALHKA